MSESTRPIIYPHGDVLLIRRGDLPAPAPAPAAPAGAEILEEVVVAEGEVTGHAHRVRGPVVTLRDESDARIEGRLSLDLPAGGAITHEEHRTIVIVPGRYEVRHQRTLSAPGLWERVRD